jgi:hypothetical protein
MDELLCRLIKERDGKKLDATSVNYSSSTCIVSFTRNNPHTSGPSVDVTSMPNPSTQPVNHFHNLSTIEGSAPTFEMRSKLRPAYLGRGTHIPHLAFLC